MGLWNICLPLILQQFETHSVSLLLKVVPICCSYSIPGVQQYVTPTFHFAAHSLKFLFFGGGGQAIYVWVPDYYLVACYSWNASENFAVSFFTEQHSSFYLQTCWNNSNIATTKAATLIMSVKLKCSTLKLNPGCSQTCCCAVDLGYHRPKTLRSLPHPHHVLPCKWTLNPVLSKTSWFGKKKGFR